MRQILNLDIPGKVLINVDCKKITLFELPCPAKIISIKLDYKLLDFEILESNVVIIKSEINFSGDDIFEIELDIEDQYLIYYLNWKK